MAKGTQALVEIEWHDAGVFTNRPLSATMPFRARNWGWLVRETEHYYYLMTGEYYDEPVETRDMDMCIIPKDWAQSVKVLLRRKV